MKFSIVTISYNQGQYLEEAITSILSQKKVDLEYIVIDPGSIDNSRQIINNYKDRIDHVIFEKDKGPANGLNKGFALASGDIFGYINSDDILMPETLEKVQKYFDKNPTTDVVSAHGYIIDNTGKIRHKIFSNKLNSTSLTMKQVCGGNYVLVQQSTFLKRSIYEKAGGFDETGNVIWDAGLAIDFMKAKAKFDVVNDYWAGCRIHSDSITGSGYFNNPKVLEQLQTYAGIKYIPSFQKKILKIYKWIREPHILILRVIDGFYNTRRLI